MTAVASFTSQQKSEKRARESAAEQQKPEKLSRNPSEEHAFADHPLQEPLIEAATVPQHIPEYDFIEEFQCGPTPPAGGSGSKRLKSMVPSVSATSSDHCKPCVPAEICQGEFGDQDPCEYCFSLLPEGVVTWPKNSELCIAAQRYNGIGCHACPQEDCWSTSPRCWAKCSAEHHVCVLQQGSGYFFFLRIVGKKVSA